MEKIHNCTEWPSFSDHELQGSAQHRSAILWVLLLLVSMLSGSQNQLCSPSSFQNYNAPISAYGPTSFFAIRDNSYLLPTPNLYTLLSFLLYTKTVFFNCSIFFYITGSPLYLIRSFPSADMLCYLLQKEKIHLYPPLTNESFICFPL